MSTPVYGPTCRYVPIKKKIEEERVCKLPEKKEVDSKLITTEKAETGNVSCDWLRGAAFRVVIG